MSNLSAFPYIAERSEGTPGLWNYPLSIISANIAAIDSGLTSSSPSGNTFSFLTNIETSGGAHFQFLSVGSTPPSYVTTAAITVRVNSATSDYLYLTDSAAQKSSYVIGSRAGGLSDGLNIWDASAGTMIASFSKQSIRFFQNVVGPVFDVGGALASTYNAATFGNGSQSIESRIQAAISQATIDGISRVYIPANMYPYSAASISFDTRTQMVREGGNWTVYDIEAYGASSLTTAAPHNRAALQAAVNGGVGAVVYVPGNTYDIGSSNSLKGIQSITGVSVHSYCVDLPPQTSLVGIRGRSTLRLASGTTDHVLLSNRSSANTSDSDILLDGIIVDGNGINNTDAGPVWFHGVTRLNIGWFKVQNTSYAACQLVQCDAGRWEYIEISSVTGQGLHVGQNGSGQMTTNTNIGTILAHEIRSLSEPNFPGNPLVAYLVNSTIGQIIAENHGAAADLKQTCSGVNIGTVLLRNCTHVAGNSGLKIQGSTSTNSVSGVNVGSVYADSQSGSGLFLTECEDINIGTYVGISNATVLDSPDVRLGGKRLSVGQILSRYAGRNAVEIRSSATDYEIGQIVAYNSNSALAGSAVQVEGGNGSIGQIIARDDRGSPMMTRALDVTSSSATLRVGTVQSVGHTVAPSSFIAGSPSIWQADSPVQITTQTLGAGNSNDYDTASGGIARISAHASGSVITGLALGYSVRRLRVVNASANQLTLSHEDTASTAANRITSPTGQGVVLWQNDTVDLEYDTTISRWRVVSVMRGVEAANGSAISPTLAFGSETSLGFYKSASSTMALSYGTLSLPANCVVPTTGLFLMGTAAGAGSAGIRLGGAPRGVEVVLADQSNYTLFRAGAYHVGIAGSAVAPEYSSSEKSLGWYPSASSTMALSYGTLSLPANCAVPTGGLYMLGTAAGVGSVAVRLGGAPRGLEAVLADQSNYTLFRAGAYYIGITGSVVAPEYSMSEKSLGWYASGVSTIALSYGTLNLATNSVRLSMRTAASLDSTSMAVNEVAFTVITSGASLGIRSGSTIWYFTSSSSTKAP